MKPLPQPLQWLAHFKSLLSPPDCPACHRPANRSALPLICSRCFPSLNKRPRCLKCGRLLPMTVPYSIDGCRYCQKLNFHFDKVFCLGPYTGAWKELVLVLKQQPDIYVMTQLAHRLGKIIRKQIKPLPESMMINVPARSGHEPHALATIAGKTARQSQLDYFKNALKYVRPTQQQHHLTRKHRLKNMRHSMEANSAVKHRNVILLDDVLTTGATLNECSRALKKAGAEQVFAVTLARGLTLWDK